MILTGVLDGFSMGWLECGNGCVGWGSNDGNWVGLL